MDLVEANVPIGYLHLQKGRKGECKMHFLLPLKLLQILFQPSDIFFQAVNSVLASVAGFTLNYVDDSFAGISSGFHRFQSTIPLPGEH